MNLIKNISAIILPACIFTMAACNQSSTDKKTTTMTDSTTNAALPDTAAYSKTINGKQTHLYILKNKHGMEAAITNYGGRVVSILVPDKADKMTDVVLGFDSVGGFVHSTERYYGATIGRYGNRIAKGKFKIDGKEYQSSTNNAPNMLHGGKNGFQEMVWDGKQIDSTTLELTYLSKDMEEGLQASSRMKYIAIADRREALKTAISLAKKEDIILIAGKGHEKYQEIKGVKNHFDDKEVVRDMFELLDK